MKSITVRYCLYKINFTSVMYVKFNVFTSKFLKMNPKNFEKNEESEEKRNDHHAQATTSQTDHQHCTLY